MEVLIEKTITYIVVAIFLVVLVIIYLRKQKRESRIVEEKIALAKEVRNARACYFTPGN